MPHRTNFQDDESDTFVLGSASFSPHTNGSSSSAQVHSSHNGVVLPHKRSVSAKQEDESYSIPGPSASRKSDELSISPNNKRRKKNHPLLNNAATLLDQRKQLPIWKGKKALTNEVRANDTVVILGETGSGKTTQVPQFLLETGIDGTGCIAITQPRRVAATSLAERVAAEQGTPLGQRVGYAVRFDESVSPKTKIKFLTDGMIIRELLSDPMLSRYNVVIVDEAHERTLRTDMLLSSLKSIQRKRNVATSNNKQGDMVPLKVIIMSATLDAERFSAFFNNAKILYIQGRQHQVKIKYVEEPQTDYVEAAKRAFFQIHVDQPPGDILIFLSGQEEIESLQASIESYLPQLPPDKMAVLVCPLYAALSQAPQQQVFAPPPPKTRKVILATNIAETSITIPGVKYVIDTGVCKEKSYQAPTKGSGVDALVIKPISKSSATQRAGRAGREGPGECYRLYTEETFKQLRDSSIPEIQRCNLTAAILDMKCLGQSPETTEFLDAPDLETIHSSLMCLYGLEALDNTGNVTGIGKKMSRFPLAPPHSRALLASQQHSCTKEVITILSVLSASSKIFIEPTTAQREIAAEARSKFRHPSGDHMTVLNTCSAYDEVVSSSGGNTDKGRLATREWCQKNYLNERAIKESKRIAAQLVGICRDLGLNPSASSGDNPDPVLRSLLQGLFNNTAMIQPDGSYRQNLGFTPVKIHPSSSMYGRKVPSIMYDELMFTSGTFARGVSLIQKSWLMEHRFFTAKTT